MRDLIIFLGSNTMAILVLTSKPSIKNKFLKLQYEIEQYPNLQFY